MCGISGAFATRIDEHQTEIIDSVMKSQFSRGPDHQAMQAIKGKDSEALFAHNRLSIIDLSQQACQPMWDVTRRYAIVYNGEIYNYLELRAELERAGLQFANHSDTEVILNAFAYWGVQALPRFQGPFAFALYDHMTDTLWLCRDRFAVRPLYYIEVNGVLYFASSTRVFAKTFNLKPNLNYVAQGLKYLVYEDGSAISPYEGLSTLPGSSYLCAKLNSDGRLKSNLIQYYDLANAVQERMEHLPVHHVDQLLHLLTIEFERAIQIRLRTDVPYAISLSGGLDSSSIASFVIALEGLTTGFTLGHPAHSNTEGPLVAQFAKYMGLQIEYISPTANEMIAGLFQTIDIQDAPFSSLSIVAQNLLYQRVHACGIKVLLGGQGGDESFMGYRKFLLFHIEELLKQKQYLATAKNVLQLLPMFLAEIRQIRSYWQHRHRYKNAKGLALSLPLPNSPAISLKANHGEALWLRQMRDIQQLSLPTLLRYEDRNAMGNSVESRLPFLDHQLVELGLALPQAVKLRAGYGKWPLRAIMANKIPDQIRLARYKRGFDIALAPLLKAGLGKAIRNALNTNGAFIKDFLAHSMNINEAFSDHELLQRQNAIAEAITLLWFNRITV